jgi:hypothetical protein
MHAFREYNRVVKVSKKIIVIEALVLLGFIAVGAAVFYVSLIYPPFPKPVAYTEAGKTKLDMPLPGFADEELVPDFLTGAVYRRSDLERVTKERAKITRKAPLVLIIGYPVYVVIRLITGLLVNYMRKRMRFGRRNRAV